MKTSEHLEVGELYSRVQLEQLFDIADQTVRTGVFRPKGHDSIWLFVTEKKRPDQTQYEDRLEGDVLHWDGQKEGRTDKRVINHEQDGLELLVFYREAKTQHPGYAFRFEGPFRYVEHTGEKPAHFRLERVRQPSDEPLPETHPVASADEVRANVARFIRDAAAHAERTRSLLSETTFWVFDPDGGRFAPSKFAGYRSMTFGTYEKALAGKVKGSFDGAVSRRAIEKTLKTSYGEMPGLVDSLTAWASRTCRDATLDGVDQSKWRFVVLPSIRRYWALFANPGIYDVEAALDHLADETWTVKDSDVRSGDRVLLWRGLKDGKRGIVGLADVVSDPEVMREPEETRRFFVGKPPDEPERRVWIRLFRPPNAPLWLEGDATGVLAGLSVARARGGTVFKLTADEWHRVVALLGGWEQSLDYDTRSGRLAEGTRSRSGQGFRASAEERRAIEDYSMALAEEYFRAQGYDVEDVSARESFDLLCLRGDEELRVEVKGTQSDGTEVLLTTNEVAHAREHSDSVALFIVHSVQLGRDNDRPTASDGITQIVVPWSIDEGTLKPTGYRYQVPTVPPPPPPRAADAS